MGEENRLSLNAPNLARGLDIVSKSLPVPSAAKSDPRAMEMIRVWIAKDGLHTALRIDFWHDQGMNEADAWGILLSDMIRHLAEAHEEAYGRDCRESILAIREAFEREIMKPTSGVRGSFTGKREVT
jgi:Domain of unknown function (DUF5076)